MFSSKHDDQSLSLKLIRDAISLLLVQLLIVNPLIRKFVKQFCESKIGSIGAIGIFYRFVGRGHEVPIDFTGSDIPSERYYFMRFYIRKEFQRGTNQSKRKDFKDRLPFHRSSRRNNLRRQVEEKNITLRRNTLSFILYVRKQEYRIRIVC